VTPDAQAGEEYDEVPLQAPSGRPRRSAHGRRMPAQYVSSAAQMSYTAFVTVLFMAGLGLTGRSLDNCPQYTDAEVDESVYDGMELSAYTAVSHDEYNRKNPKWKKAIAQENPDRDKWLEADEKERVQQMKKRKGKDEPTMDPVDRGKHGVPYGQKIYPIKRHCKIKSDGTYKVRWVVLGNLDDYDGDTYAPTASRKTIWLLFALSITLGLYRRFFDITGAFMERYRRETSM